MKELRRIVLFLKERAMENDLTRQIRARAYEIWEEEGRPHGRAKEHWAQAEREFRAGESSESVEAGPAAARPRKTRPTRAAEPQATKKPGRRKQQPGAD
jgi:hypothetical protein